jgi:alpha-L-glutamate ligase-like protein
MFKFNFSNGVLGLNARNLLYIRQLNSKESINFADSKLKTKHYLSARNIPVPKLYAVIKSHEDLNKFDFASLPGSVVLKPNKGSGGDGIIAFKERKGSNFITVNGRVVGLEELKSHIIDIIDGRFSMTNTKDTAFFEQRILTDNELAKYTYQGLPDVRIIVYNLIPVMAMLRLPTRESEGKANMAQGALGVGIDIGTGKPTYIAKKFNIIDEIPDVGKFDPKFKIPYWDEILLIASKCQQLTNLGYLACDIALDENNGPILLELNARAGLKVQIANKAPLRKRLEQIKDIKVNTPEKGVRLAKDLFTKKDQKISKQLVSKKIISLEENVELITKSGKYILKTLIDPQKKQTDISEQIVNEIGLKISDRNTVKLKLNLKNEKIITIGNVKKNLKNFELILGNKEIQNFLISPAKKAKLIPSNQKIVTKNKDFFIIPQIDYGTVDHLIHQVSSKTKFLSRIRPQNLLEELAKYNKDNSYNPQFYYKTSTDLLITLYQKLATIKTDDSPLGLVFENKKNELFNMLKIIEYIGTDDFSHYANILFPVPTESELKMAMKLKKNYKYYKELKVKKYYSAKEVGNIFKDVLSKYGLNQWKILFSDKIVADCSVSKNRIIFIKESAKFQEYRVNKLIAHEIETHVLTAENGKKQPYQIFQNGTANYLETQEGLAIYNQELALHIYPNNYFAAGPMYNAHLAINNSFTDAVEILRREGMSRNYAITCILKSKRGMNDTSKLGGIAKQAIYFRGAQKIDKFVKAGGKLEDLYIGKISIDELDTFKQIKSLNKPAILPNWY